MSTTPQEKTFRAYTSTEGKNYAVGRPPYPPALYDIIFKHHAATGGSFDLLLDVGCGPGNCTRFLAPTFEKVIGADASPGMIESARELGGTSKSEAPIRYEVSSAEGYSGIEGLEEGSVDMITVAAAAHWFDMPKFWAEAAKVLKPGGTVAIWTRAPTRCHPSSPNATKLRAILHNFENVVLAPWEQPGSRISRNYYDDLILPWTLSDPIVAFPKSEFVKHEYDRNETFTNGTDFFFGGTAVTLKHIEMGLSTASPVNRWREAHPELVGTDKDIVKVLIKEFKEVIGDAESVVTGNGWALLLVKKAAV